ncbi:hypothetical protein SS50377_26858 [Spironucleus salmonicida]|uniref:Uncharacterized protein n=1 Tax=Spironucleus salmonicida TaxID=348837 RepID=V6LZY5_9EUKA|nr:hypothetical protein SS50377_26858 [Spironucleus salmonicida]|eukprot:EST49326.1 Hypothetical protein SS50377_10552 [Spironucleus salmonicida]
MKLIPRFQTLISTNICNSPCPYFSVAHDNLISIAGGGGPSKSGVPNIVQIFNQHEEIAQFSTFQEANFYVLKIQNFVFLAGTNHLRKLILIKNKKYSLKETKKIEIDEPRGFIEWRNLLILAENITIKIFNFDLKIIKQFQVSEDCDELQERVIDISTNQQTERLLLVIVTNKQVYHYDTGIEYKNYGLQHTIEIFENHKYRKIEFFTDDYYFAIQHKQNSLLVLDGGFDPIFYIKVQQEIANFVYSSQEKLLVVVTVTGLVKVYKFMKPMKFKLLCQKHSKIDNFIHDLSFYSESGEIIILGVDGFETMKIAEKDYNLHIGWIFIIFLVLVMGIWVKQIRDQNLRR